MKNKKSLLSIGIIVLVLFLGVGYAVVSSVYLNISGTANVSDSDLKVEITNAVATTNVANKTVDFSHQLSNKNLTSNFTLNEMELGEKVDITYTVTNNENDVDAELASSGVAISNTNPDHFRVSYVITDSITDLANNDKTMEVVVSVELIKTAVAEANSSTTVELSLTASPKGLNENTGNGNINISESGFVRNALYKFEEDDSFFYFYLTDDDIFGIISPGFNYATSLYDVYFEENTIKVMNGEELVYSGIVGDDGKKVTFIDENGNQNLFLLDMSTKDTFALAEGTEDNIILFFAFARGTTWEEHMNSFYGNYMKNFHIDANGHIYIGNMEGYMVYNDGTLVHKSDKIIENYKYYYSEHDLLGSSSVLYSYNGIVLPEIESREGYDYIYLYSISGNSLNQMLTNNGYSDLVGQVDTVYITAYSTSRFSYIKLDSYGLEGIGVSQIIGSVSFITSINMKSMNNWFEISKNDYTSGSFGINFNSDTKLIWTNTDIIDSNDYSVYFKSSLPEALN